MKKYFVKEATLPLDMIFASDVLYLEGHVEVLPSHLLGWDHVRNITLKWPKFKGDLSVLFSLPRLEILKIIETPLSELRLPLGHVTAPLTTLIIKDCGLKFLPEEISLLGSLKELSLSGNHLSQLPHSFGDLRSLKRLNLDQNSFTLFPNVFKSMPQLTHLSIDGNPFSEEEKERIQREFHIWL